MGVPVLGRVKGVRRLIGEGDLVLLDVGQASAFVRPNPAMEEAFESRLSASQKKRAAYAAMKAQPPITKDDVRVTLMVNAWNASLPAASLALR